MSAAETFTLPNAQTLICACSASHARVWKSRTRLGEWELVAELSDEDADLRERDIVSDRPGRTFDRRGGGRHAMEPQTSARDHEKRRFARQIGEFLNGAIASGEARHLVLFAGPRFLGLLRGELSANATAAVALAASKNLTQLEASEVRAYFEG